MAFLPLKFSKSWKNSQDFPTYEPDEAQVRADMQLLHDETKDSFNALVDALNATSAAENLPFRPGQELKSATIQAAIEEVYEAGKQAAAGVIPDHTITKEKLTLELLRRVYGGRVWVSVETPGATQSPETDFPVGQLWLRPAFTMTNLAKDNWTVAGGTKEQVEGGWKLVSDGTSAAVTATQTLASVGSAGDRVAVYLDTRQHSVHLSELSLVLNGLEHDLMTGECAFEGTLDQSGDLEVTVAAGWPYERPGESVQMRHLTVVNVTRLEQALIDCRFPTDWPKFVQKAVPFTAQVFPLELYVQVQPSRWEAAVYETLPEERGGTGLNRYEPGQMLYADADGKLQQLNPPSKQSFLSYSGKPVWQEPVQCLQTMGGLRIATGTYQGNGQNGRAVTLPVVPKLLYFQGSSVPMVTQHGVVDSPTVLANGGTALEECTGSTTDGFTTSYSVSAVLQGSKLQFRWQYGGSKLLKNPATHLGNRSGVTYTWYAIY